MIAKRCRTRWLMLARLLLPNQPRTQSVPRPTARCAALIRSGPGKRTGTTPSLGRSVACSRAMTGIVRSEPAEDAVRAEANSPLRRFNPFWSWQKDGDYTVTRSVGGLLSRHDRNSVGAADSLLLGMLAESRPTT